jgi:putative membrane protein
MLFARTYGMMGYGWGGIIIGSLFVLFLIVLIILGIMVIIKIGRRKYGHEGPLDILKRRYARGEITKADFEAVKKDIVQ